MGLILQKEKTMTLIRYNTPSYSAPRRVDFLSQVNKELDQILNEVFNGHYFTNKKNTGYPRMDAIKSKDALICQFTVPGVKLEDINVDLAEDENGRLMSISGKLSEEYSNFDENSYQIKELSKQEFRRIIRLPEDISKEEPLAVLRNGILTLTFKLLKTEVQEPEIKKVKIIEG